MRILQRLRIQRQDLRIRMFLLKPVQMVALFLEFTPLQICQIVNGIEIVIAVAVAVDLERTGVQLLHLTAVRFCQRCQTAGNAANGSIMEDRIQHLFNIALAHGVKIYDFSVKLGLNQQKAIHFGHTFSAPQI